MDDVRYEPVVACLRAPRFVVAYRPGPDWVHTARRVIQSLSRVWAGAGAVILPAGRTAHGDPDLSGLIRSYDPDIIAGHVPLVEDETHIDRAAEQGDDGTGARDPAVLRHILTQAIDVGPWDDIARLADAWCSPFKGVHQDAKVFKAHEVVHMARQDESYPYLTLMPPLVDRSPLVTLDLSSVDPVVALMIETRTGAFDVHDQAELRSIALPVEDADLKDLVRIAVTGQARLAGWDPGQRYQAALGVAVTGGASALSAEQFMQRTPFARTREWLIDARTSGAAPPPAVGVIGDTAADHALAVLCDRLFHRAGWIPLSVWQDQNLASAARLGIYELGHVTGSPTRPVLVTSISQSQDTLRSLISELRPYGLGVPGDPRGRFDVIPPGDLAKRESISSARNPG
jgi:hypothetical protein